jgi:chromosome segregation ATPase
LERLRAFEQHAAAIPAMTTELERLRKVEETAREQVAVMARLAGDAASARAEAEGYRRSAAALETEFQRMRSDLTATREDLASTREESASLVEQRDRARDELSAVQSQLDASMSLARQQSLTSQRSLMEVILVRQELDRCKAEYQQELDGYKMAYQEAADLLIPLRVRRALPEPLKAPSRAIKRALRSLTRRTP